MNNKKTKTSELMRYSLLLCVLFVGVAPLFAQQKLRSLSDELEVLQYMMDDEEYDSVILNANSYLLNGDLSYEDEGTIVSYKVEALFQDGQYGEFSQDFASFAKDFPRSNRLPYLYYLEMGSRFFRRHYYTAIESGDMGIRTGKGLNRRNDNKILKKAAKILEDNVLDEQLYTLYDDASRKMKTTLVTEMINRGLEPPIDSSLLIPEYDDIWQDRATSNYFRGSVVAGTAFPFFGVNKNYNEVNKTYPKMSNAFTVDFSGTYRILNGIGVGASLSFARWSADVLPRIPLDTGAIVDAIKFDDGSMYLAGMGIVRIYLPKIKKKYQIFLEPGAGYSYFAHWQEMKDADWLFTAKGDIGITFNRTFEIRGTYKLVNGYSYDNFIKSDTKELYQWAGVSVGIVLRRYSSKGRQKAGAEEWQTGPAPIEEDTTVVEEAPKEESITDIIESTPVEEEPVVEEAPEEPIEPGESSIFDDFK